MHQKSAQARSTASQMRSRVPKKNSIPITYSKTWARKADYGGRSFNDMEVAKRMYDYDGLPAVQREVSRDCWASLE